MRSNNFNAQSARDEALGVRGDNTWKQITESETIGVGDVWNDVTVPAVGSITATLPYVGSAPGRIYHFVCSVDAGGTSVIVQDQNETLGADLELALTAVGDYAIVQDLGYVYAVLASRLT